MRSVVQRVSRAAVQVEGETIARIALGYLALLCAEQGDDEKDARYIIDKIAGLRIFEDEDGKMNLDIREVSGEVLLVSQFTLAGDARKGRRPSFSAAARPEDAAPLMESVREGLIARGIPVQTGRFQADMRIELVNSGPVTLLLDSRRLF